MICCIILQIYDDELNLATSVGKTRNFDLVGFGYIR